MQRSKSKAKEITIVMMLVVIVIFSVLTVELKIRESCKTELQYPVYKRLLRNKVFWDILNKKEMDIGIKKYMRY